MILVLVQNIHKRCPDEMGTKSDPENAKTLHRGSFAVDRKDMK